MRRLGCAARVPSLVACLAMFGVLPAAEVDVYLLGGQSNMQGLGKVSELPADVPREFARVRYWTGRDFEPLVLGSTRTAGRPGELGPEVGLAWELSQPITSRTSDSPTTAGSRPICLVKYFASGMPLHHGWHAGTWQGGEPQPGRRNFYPGERADDPCQGILYREMSTRFRTALERLREGGDTPVVRGFAWMQGEQDSKHEESATHYAESLRRLRRRLAEDVGVDAELPMVFGQVLPHEPALPRFTHRREVREQMAAADSESGRPEAMPRTRMVSTDGLGMLPDTVHYNTAGQLELGRAFGRALRSIQAVP